MFLCNSVWYLSSSEMSHTCLYLFYETHSNYFVCNHSGFLKGVDLRHGRTNGGIYVQESNKAIQI